MWIQFNDDQLAALIRIAEHADNHGRPCGGTSPDADVIRERIAWYSAPGTNDQAFRDAVPTSDELECDDDAVTSISDAGAFVMTWTWVSNEEAGIEDDDPDHGAQLFEEPQPMGERGNSVLKSDRVEGFNFID